MQENPASPFLSSSYILHVRLLLLRRCINTGGFLEELLSKYGYVAIFVLTFFEGESVLIAAGFLAFSGYLDAIAVRVTFQ